MLISIQIPKLFHEYLTCKPIYLTDYNDPMNTQNGAPIYQTVYVSSANGLIDEPGLEQMLSNIRAKNAKLQVTGILLYADGNIMQVLEGERALIEELMQKIMTDSRHKGVIVLLEESIEQRQFADWSMAYRNLSNTDADGFSDFLAPTASADEAQLRASRAKSLLVRFRNSMGR